EPAVQGADGPLHADFHSLRHTAVAVWDRHGLTLKQAMALARHSDPRLAARIYGRARLDELGAAGAGVCVIPQVGAKVSAQRGAKRRKDTKEPERGQSGSRRKS